MSWFTQTPWVGSVTYGTARTTPGAPVYRSMSEPPQVMVMARIGNKRLNDPYCEPYDFFSSHPAATPFLFGDGSVQMIKHSTNPTILQALATRAGGEPTGSFD
jgi:hypothetical protein